MKIKPEIVAELFLSNTVDGGRSGPIRKGEYRGVVGVQVGCFSVCFDVEDEDGVEPGESTKVGIQFLAPYAALRHFPVDSEFTLWEGREIGKGKVLQVLSTN
jgi:hypothetical protein